MTNATGSIVLLSAAALLAMLGTAAAMGAGNPNDGVDIPSRFVVSVPTVDTGSVAYPSTQGMGSSPLIVHGPRFNPALYDHADTGGQQAPPGLR